MTIKELLIEADAIQVGVVESDWQRVIKLAARPLEAKGFISTEYSQGGDRQYFKSWRLLRF